MDAAKAAVKDFMARAGHHDTTVHEKVAPAVTHETITKTEHENLTTAIDREVHQDHYHTSVQPVLHEETLDEQHHHRLIPVEHRSFQHGDKEHVERRLAEEAAKYQDEVVRVEGKRTSTVVPVVTGEHIHHHVHETIQPIVQKSTIEPHIIHTTIPIHEVHHNAAHHHATSALPAVSMADFKKQGGVLTGRAERKDGFAGEPRSVGKALGSDGDSEILAGDNDNASVTTAGKEKKHHFGGLLHRHRKSEEAARVQEPTTFEERGIVEGVREDGGGSFSAEELEVVVRRSATLPSPPSSSLQSEPSVISQLSRRAETLPSVVGARSFTAVYPANDLDDGQQQQQPTHSPRSLSPPQLPPSPTPPPPRSTTFHGTATTPTPTPMICTTTTSPFPLIHPPLTLPLHIYSRTFQRSSSQPPTTDSNATSPSAAPEVFVRRFSAPTPLGLSTLTMERDAGDARDGVD